MTSLVGHDAEITEFRTAALGERMHHAWLIAGPKGVGKGLFARQAARWLLSYAAGPAFDGSGLEVPDDHPIAHLVDEQSHPDYRLLTRLVKEGRDKVEKLARDISIDQVRAMQHVLESRPAMSDRRVIVIDAMDEFNASGANALLKSLEEPPSGAVFLLVSHAPGRLLPTIRSRCRLLELKPLGESDMAKALAQVDPPIAEAERGDLIALAGGSPGLAAAFAGLDVAALDAALVRIAANGDPGMTERTALAKALSPKTALARYEIFLDRVPGFIAAQARQAQGDQRARAIAAWEKARELGPASHRLTLEPYMVVFEMGSLVAGLAPQHA